MIIVTEVLLIAAMIAFLGYPILRNENDPSVFLVSEDDLKEDLILKKEYVYMNLRDLETDHSTGKISDEDYKQLKRKYEHQAIKVMKEIDHVGEKKTDNINLCSKCGRKASSTDQFCTECGTRL